MPIQRSKSATNSEAVHSPRVPSAWIGVALLGIVAVWSVATCGSTETLGTAHRTRTGLPSHSPTTPARSVASADSTDTPPPTRPGPSRIASTPSPTTSPPPARPPAVSERPATSESETEAVPPRRVPPVAREPRDGQSEAPFRITDASLARDRLPAVPPPALAVHLLPARTANTADDAGGPRIALDIVLSMPDTQAELAEVIVEFAIDPAHFYDVRIEPNPDQGHVAFSTTSTGAVWRLVPPARRAARWRPGRVSVGMADDRPETVQIEVSDAVAVLASGEQWRADPVTYRVVVPLTHSDRRRPRRGAADVAPAQD